MKISSQGSETLAEACYECLCGVSQWWGSLGAPAISTQEARAGGAQRKCLSSIETIEMVASLPVSISILSLVVRHQRPNPHLASEQALPGHVYLGQTPRKKRDNVWGTCLACTVVHMGVVGRLPASPGMVMAPLDHSF